MIPFELHKPTSIAEALDLLEKYGEDARPIAGGTALVLLMEQRLVRPGHLISLGKIGELNNISANGELRVGAGVQHRVLEMNPQVKAGWPLLTNAYHRVATVRIRNVATVGGGLAHADPNMDMPQAYIVSGATVKATSRAGSREIPVEQFYKDYYETALNPGEVVTEVSVPAQPPRTSGAYLKFLPRTADDYATVSVAARLTLGEDGQTIE